MMRAPIALAACLAAGSAVAAPELPSGLAAEPHDIAVEIQPDDEAWLVVRFIAPAIAGGAVDYETVLPDLEHLCAVEALPRLPEVEREIALILVVVMDRPVVRGQPDPEAVQYIGAFLPSEEGCIWE